MSSRKVPLRKHNRLHIRLITILVLCAAYIGSYLLLSRIGYRQSQSLGVDGFCFVMPRGPITASLHFLCVVVYYPLIVIDTTMGFPGPVKCILLDLSA